MSSLNENPYSPPSTSGEPPDGHNSRWRIVWAAYFFVIGASTALTGIALVPIAIYQALDGQMPSGRSILRSILWTIIGGLWIWTASSFWIANYRRGLLTAAIGFAIYFTYNTLVGH